MDKLAVSDVQREYLAVLERVEELRNLGVKKLIYTPLNLTELKLQIESIRDSDSLMSFRTNGYLDQLTNLTRACGLVCCRYVIKPGSPMQFFSCSSCPIEKFESSYLGTKQNGVY
ncbi:hypothetical protein PCCS19_21350 [Paenibacillus sp. CCS19]|uniref:hypothetical protein n=1 Tax=Paenibacillus sp. CCS19 TaxID=3158387 RepID=UPI0025612589|nr:hypothetical protein [Paenibacillus cellulosilyticus]GMK39081.1 hypothetical protein PCCS19_21350 [Paenibacillus cellulosilyticus]